LVFKTLMDKKLISITTPHTLDVSNMDTVVLSSKYRIVIPQNIREKVDLKLGQKIVVIEKDGVIHLIPQKPIKEMRGFLKGIDATQLRDDEDRF
jgi:AbrB family looped-hinge helix DNA binding protein